MIKLHFSKVILLIFSLLISFSCLHAYSQETTTADETLLFSDIDSVFAISKQEQKITNAPARVSVVTAQEIVQYGYRSLVDVLNSIPGFQTTYDRSFSYLGARGFSVSGDYNTRILLLVDGHRVNENIYDGILIDNGLITNINLIDRIEVVRGSGSSLYGNNAFFGILNIITKRGRDIQGVEVIGSLGSQNTYETTVTFGKRFNNGLEALFSGSYYESEGNDALYFAEFDEPFTNNGYALNSDKGDNHGLFAKLTYDSFTLSAAFQDQTKQDPTAPYDSVFNGSGYINSEKSAYVDLKYQQLLADGTDLTARLYYNDYTYDSVAPYDYSWEGDLSDIELWFIKEDGRNWGAELAVAKVIFEHHRINAGLEYISNIEQLNNSWDSYGVINGFDTSSYQWGAYVQDEFAVQDNIALNIAFRYDYFSNTDNSQVTPRIAAIWEPLDTTSVKLIYANAFRAPNITELFFDDGYSQKAPENLRIEKIESAELIIEHNINKALKFMLSFYDNNIQDLISLTLDPEDDFLVYRNLENVNVNGLELELLGHWQNGWNTSISYAYQDASFDVASEERPIVPKDQLKLSIATPALYKGFSAGLSLQYEGGRNTIGGNKTDSYVLANLTLLNQNLVKNLDVSLGIYNLFDKQYAHPASKNHRQDQLMQDGRSYRLRFMYTFEL